MKKEDCCHSACHESLSCRFAAQEFVAPQLHNGKCLTAVSIDKLLLVSDSGNVESIRCSTQMAISDHQKIRCLVVMHHSEAHIDMMTALHSQAGQDAVPSSDI